MHGACREGDNCIFSHDPKSKPSMVCKYYQLGCCSYGSKCRSVLFVYNKIYIFGQFFVLDLSVCLIYGTQIVYCHVQDF